MRFGSIVLVAGLLASQAQASFTVSDKPTKDVVCDEGVCTPTAGGANLNAGALEALLADGDAKLVSEHNTRDIVIQDPVTWSSDHKLTLDSYRGITFKAEVIDEGTGDVALLTGDGAGSGRLLFLGRGRLAFWDTGVSFTLNGQAYTLAGGVAGLKAAIEAQPNGFFALANDYDASADGTYHAAPIAPTHFSGVLNGLGNTIRHLKIRSRESGAELGLMTESFGAIRNLRLDKLNIEGQQVAIAGGIAARCHTAMEDVIVSGRIQASSNSTLGGICGTLETGFIVSSRSSGIITGTGRDGSAGGLVGNATSQSTHITTSFSTASVAGLKYWHVGGLAGRNLGMIETSYASGNVLVDDNGVAGGLIGDNSGLVFYVYANGAVTGAVHTTVGGLIGISDAQVSASYSSGAVASGSGNAVGGFVGDDEGILELHDNYWDITTSGQSHGAGNDTSDPGITGLTHEEFQAGLPEGLPASVWAEAPGINDGLPYLRELKPGP